MNKKYYIIASASISIIAGLIAVALFSALGFSIAKVADPTFYTSFLGLKMVELVLSLVFMGISLGALFAGVRFLGKVQAIGTSLIITLITALIGSVMFWSHISSYTILAAGLVCGAAIGGLFASSAKGTKFGIGFDQTKKVFVVLAIVAFLGTMLMVSGNEEYYRNQFSSSITGLTSISASEIDNSTLEQMVRNTNPRMTWDEFVVEAQVNDYNSLTVEQQQTLRELYHNYTINYENAVAGAVQTTRENLANSSAASSTILNSLSFFKAILDNIALFYAAALASAILLLESIVIAPVAGLTSWAFQKPLPERLQPKPKDEILEVAWTGE